MESRSRSTPRILTAPTSGMTQSQPAKPWAMAGICRRKRSSIFSSATRKRLTDLKKESIGLAPSIPLPTRGTRTGPQGIPATRPATVRRMPSMCELSDDPSFNPLIF